MIFCQNLRYVEKQVILDECAVYSKQSAVRSAQQLLGNTAILPSLYMSRENR